MIIQLSFKRNCRIAVEFDFCPSFEPLMCSIQIVHLLFTQKSKILYIQRDNGKFLGMVKFPVVNHGENQQTQLYIYTLFLNFAHGGFVTVLQVISPILFIRINDLYFLFFILLSFFVNTCSYTLHNYEAYNLILFDIVCQKLQAHSLNHQ